MASPHPTTRQSDQHSSAVLIGIGLAAGLIGSFFGLGGGIVFVPLIAFALRRPMHQATVTSLATMQFLAVFALCSYLIDGHRTGELLVRWDVVGLLAPAAVLGSSLIGVPLGQRLPSGQLRTIFAVLLFFVAIRMMGGVQIGGASLNGDPWPVWAALPCGIVVGSMSGLLGVGGGVLSVPILVLGFLLDQHQAHGTSMVVVLASAVAGTLRAHHSDDPEKRPNWHLALRIAPGAIIGAIIGPQLAGLVSGGALRDAFAVVMFVSGARMLGVTKIIGAHFRAKGEG